MSVKLRGNLTIVHYDKIPPSASFWFNARNVRLVHALPGVGSPPPEDDAVASDVVCWQRESQSGDCYADKSSSLLALSRMVSIPEYVLVQDVADVLAGETPASDRDAWLRRRIEFADRILLDYAKALIPIRSSGLTEHADFLSGL